jgi:hypothetical protein
MCPTVIDKSQPIESMGSRLCDHTRIFDSDVRARCNSRRTLPGEGIENNKTRIFSIRDGLNIIG